jgi:hypothetical protein
MRHVACTASLAAVVLGVGGCGGSTMTSATTTATQSSPAGTSPATAPASVSPGHVPPSTPIDSPAYLGVLEQSAAQGAHLSPNQAAFAATCTQRGLLAAGFKTQGDSEGSVNGQKSVRIFIRCLQQGRSH